MNSIKLIILSLVPALSYVVTYVAWKIISRVKSQTYKTHRNTLSITMIVAFIAYPSIVDYSLTSVSCVTIID